MDNDMGVRSEVISENGIPGRRAARILVPGEGLEPSRFAAVDFESPHQQQWRNPDELTTINSTA
jgi:hypothetical protein